MGRASIITRCFAYISRLIVFAGLSAPVSAQTLEEITVTAQKREESVQDIPLTVNAISAESLEEFAINDLFEVELHRMILAADDTRLARARPTSRLDTGRGLGVDRQTPGPFPHTPSRFAPRPRRRRHAWGDRHPHVACVVGASAARDHVAGPGRGMR